VAKLFSNAVLLGIKGTLRSLKSLLDPVAPNFISNTLMKRSCAICHTEKVSGPRLSMRQCGRRRPGEFGKQALSPKIQTRRQEKTPPQRELRAGPEGCTIRTCHSADVRDR
jgi:hypothetical protein